MELKKFKFYKKILLRYFLILFRKDKSIQLLYLEYDTEHLFSDSYIIIRYQFRNAVWYQFGEYITWEDHVTILNVKNNATNLNLKVYGFFCKKEYQVKLEPNLIFDSRNFKAEVLGLKLNLIPHQASILSSSRINIVDKIIETSFVKRRINNEPIKFKTNQYNLKDFI